MGRLEGKVAVVSGAARGMGAEIARRFSAEGAAIVLGDVLADEAGAVAAAIGERARAVRLDVTQVADWDTVVEVATAAFGGVDILVNGAGIVRLHPIVDGDPEVAREIIMVNQFGTYLGLRACAKAMGERGGGSIINISSMQGIAGMPFVSAYVSSKFGVRGLTKAAALELGPSGIRCNSIHPGYVDTPMLRANAMGSPDAHIAALGGTVPIGRVGTVDDVAHLVVFLASDESAYCTGAEIAVDGGMLAGFFPPGLRR
jgi:3alpha(or 20beta)-hydroxysteroid dehydrogenase